MHLAYETLYIQLNCSLASIWSIFLSEYVNCNKYSSWFCLSRMCRHLMNSCHSCRSCAVAAAAVVDLVCYQSFQRIRTLPHFLVPSSLSKSIFFLETVKECHKKHVFTPISFYLFRACLCLPEPMWSIKHRYVLNCEYSQKVLN